MVAEFFLSKEQRYDYLDNATWDSAAHNHLQEFWSVVLLHMFKRMNCRIMFSGNYTYGNERDAHVAATELGLGVVILYKECFMSKGHSEDLVKVLRKSKPFSGAKILLYNAEEVERQLSSGMAKSNQLAVVGSPRFDKYIISSRKVVPVSCAKIVFFIHDVIPVSNQDFFSIEQDSFNNFSNSQIDFGLRLFEIVALEYPNIVFELKTKVTRSTIEKISKWSNSIELPSNLVITQGGLSDKSMSNCVGAFGFNTTALVDAMASGIPISVMRFSTKDNQYEKFVIDYGIGASYISTHEDFRDWVDNILKSQDESGNIHQSIPPENFDYLQKAVGNSDAKSGLRVLREIMQINQTINTSSFTGM